MGMQLKKTSQNTTEKKEKNQTMGNDVASILARRIAVEFSDSDDDYDDDEDDSGWSDDD